MTLLGNGVSNNLLNIKVKKKTGYEPDLQLCSPVS
jgi:hypothetical protein